MVFIYKSILLAYWAFITILALMPAPQSENLFPFSDKILHFISFLVLLFLFDKSFKKQISPLTVVGLFCYGILIEFIQSLTPTRSAEITDILANLLGLLVYYYFAPKLTNERKT